MQPPDFDSLYRTWLSPLVSFLERRGAAGSDVDDLAQNIFLRFFKLTRSGKYSPEPPFLFHIARYALKDHFRTEAHRYTKDHLPLENLPEGKIPRDRLSPDRAVASRQDLRRLMEQIDLLPDDARQVLLLYRFRGLPKRQIANQLGLPLRRVNLLLEQAFCILMDEMEDDL